MGRWHLFDKSSIDVITPVTKKDLAGIGDEIQHVQWSKPLTADDYRRISEAVRPFPEVSIRAYLFAAEGDDLCFLSHFPETLHVGVECYKLRSFDGLRALSPRLESLTLGLTLRRAKGIESIRRFSQLKHLTVEAQPAVSRHFDALPELRTLYLRSTTLPSLESLAPCKHLWWLWLGLGGTRDLSGIDRVGRIRFLELWFIRGLCDLTPISGLRFLEELHLESLKRVLALPTMDQLCSLQRVTLQHMSGLRDVLPLRATPNLKDLLALDGSHHQPDDFKCLRGHPTLDRFSPDLGSDRKNNGASALLGLPTVNSTSQLRSARWGFCEPSRN